MVDSSMDSASSCTAVKLHHAVELRCLGIDLIQVAALALPEFARVFDALLDPSYFGAGFVKAALNGAQRICIRGLVGANALDLCLGFAQIREHRLHRSFATRCRGIANPGFRIKTLQPQRQQLRGQLSLLFFERLIAAGGGGLALQVADLLLHLFAQVVQAIQILARVADAAFGLAAPLLVAGNARRLFEESAQVLGPRLDHARDHALLDDGVAARAQTGAEKQLRDVLAAHLQAIDEIVGRTVAAHGSLERDLVVARVRAADLPIRIVEHQFHRRLTQGLARCGAVEDHVGH